MESQPQNPELRNNPQNFHLCIIKGVHCIYICIGVVITHLRSIR